MTDTILFTNDEGDRDSWPRLPGYDVLEIVGRGGLSVVYRACQNSLNRDVAIRSSNSVVSEHRGSQFILHEAKILARIQHPHVVSILDCIDDRERVYLVLEYVAGGTLASKLNGQQQGPILACSIVERLALTAHSFHRHGIVHCNLKPSNILLAVPPSDQGHNSRASQTYEEVFGIPIISSFGLALDDERRASLRDGEVFGTLAYMAPEQAAGRCHAIGPASDVYALGAILYTTLTGHPPFALKGAETSSSALIRQVLEQEPEPVSRLNRTVDGRLDAICRTCLSKRPESRYGSALELALALRDYRERSHDE